MIDRDNSKRGESNLPERVLRFLHAIGTRSDIRKIMATRGYDDAEHERAWKLLRLACENAVHEPTPLAERNVKTAVATIVGWHKANARVARAALRTRFVAQYEFLVQDEADKDAFGRALGFTTRLDSLATGRKDHRRQDHAAIALLAKRGITASERARVRALLAIVTSPRAPSAQPKRIADATRAYDTARAELAAFYEEWRVIAHAANAKCNQLIVLGLARRKSPRRPASRASATAAELPQ